MKYGTELRMQLELRNVCNKRIKQGFGVIEELEPPVLTAKAGNPFINIEVDYSIEKKWE